MLREMQRTFGILIKTYFDMILSWCIKPLKNSITKHELVKYVRLRHTYDIEAVLLNRCSIRSHLFYT